MGINWDKVRLIMEKAVRGRAPSYEEDKLIQAAFRADKKKYGELSKEVRAEAQDEANPWGKV